MNKNRLEAFSDGVMAIIITIMALELKAPKGNTLKDLQEVLPAFFSYVQSFWFVGVYWNNHHHLMHTVKRVTGPMLVLNMLLLFCLSLIPFATAWVGETHFSSMPVAVYAVALVSCAFAWTALQIHIEKTNNWNEAIKMAMDRQGKKGWVSTIMYLAGIPLAFVNPLISEALFVITAFMWLMPDKNIERIFEAEKRSE